MPSASLPKGEPNGAPVTTALNSNLAAVAGKERQNVERLNTPSFSEIKAKDKESSGQISKQEQGKQFENQNYEIRTDGRKEANPILPESYFLNDKILIESPLNQKGNQVSLQSGLRKQRLIRLVMAHKDYWDWVVTVSSH